MVLSFSGFAGVHNFHFILYVISVRAKAKWIKIAGKYSVGFRVPTNREQIDPLKKNSDNCDISPN